MTWVKAASFFNRIIQPGTGTRWVSYSFWTRGCFLRLKRPEPETDHSPTSSADKKNIWSCKSSSTPFSLHSMVLIRAKGKF